MIKQIDALLPRKHAGASYETGRRITYFIPKSFSSSLDEHGQELRLPRCSSRQTLACRKGYDDVLSGCWFSHEKNECLV